LYLLLVKAPESATASTLALRYHLPLLGGWTVADEQRFWLALGADGAVNLEGGDATQMACLRPDGRYDLVPPRWTTRAARLTCRPDCLGAPGGGTLMYFYIREPAKVK
jgi:hypothetical protein